ncbi:MAG: hypothetical protein ACYC91_08190 [Solirubrobacteraceae bacterium]
MRPHFGTLIETAEQIERALDVLEIGWCLDTEHLLIGGVEAALFAREQPETSQAPQESGAPASRSASGRGAAPVWPRVSSNLSLLRR